MYKIVTIDNEEYAMPDEEFFLKQKLYYQIKLKQANIPSFYWDINFDDYQGNKQSQEFKIIYNFAHNFFKDEFKHVHLYLYGDTSTQKSALMYNVGKVAIQQSFKVKSILAGQLIDKLMKIQGFNFNEQIYNEIQELKQCDILLIDDFGDIRKTLLWQNEQSKNIILVEWDKFLRDIVVSDTHIVMTSNYSLDLVKEYFGEYVFELLDRNFYPIYLPHSIKEVRKNIVKEKISKLSENKIQVLQTTNNCNRRVPKTELVKR